jgi:hypothetical protein
MTAPELKKNHPLAFFGLMYAMSAPFWIIAIRRGKDYKRIGRKRWLVTASHGSCGTFLR